MESYNPAEIEPKWQKVWEENPTLYAAVDKDKTRDKYYVLVEFPYPSGDGLHTGHVRSYAAQDIIARRLRMVGKNVLYPIGWDAFGLPTENYAIKNKIRPQDATAQNVATFKRQIKALGLSFDWTREINTTDPKYYKWTQWIFLQLLKHDLAYQAEIPINWCPKEKIGLANEEVVGGVHERCGTPVERKVLKQWMLRITKYADRLIDGLKAVDYSPQIEAGQVNWVGKSRGAQVEFELHFTKNPADNDRRGPDGKPAHLEVFTTRIDTLFGATYLVLAPEHPWVQLAVDDNHDVLENKQAVRNYVEKAINRSELERQEDTKAKTGVELKGVKAINPATGEQIPMWVADYVLSGYGTGAIMAVPAHDERDFEFAQKFNLPIKRVISGGDLPYIGDGKLVDSSDFNGMPSPEARGKITNWLAEQGKARATVQYKLRDWVFSRQHYWGEPIPVIHCEQCGVVPVPEQDLPVELPDVEHYEPTDTGESPLAAIADWVNVLCPNCAGPAKRETDTMPNWAGSSWYYLRYIDPHNDEAFAAPDKLKYWLPVDLYNGGMEHTTLHLLYSRFWHQFLYDQKLVPTPEPYAARRSHGIILAADGRKMSKSLGNVVNPDDMVKKYGADATRVYEMFMGPYDQQIEWNEDKLAGAYRFLNRIWNLAMTYLQPTASPQPTEQLLTGTLGTFETEVDRMMHKTLKKLDEEIGRRSFNTMVSTLMEGVNFLLEPRRLAQIKQPDFTELRLRTLRLLLLMLAPITPHLAEEIWHQLGESVSVHAQAWPKYDPALVKDDLVTIVVQVNGRVRGEFITDAGLDVDELETRARLQNEVEHYTRDAAIARVVVVPNRLVNFVVKN